VGWHGHFVDELGAQSLDRAPGREILRIAGERDRRADGADERCDGSTRLQRVAVTAKALGDLEPDVTGAHSNVLRISNSKIDEPDISRTCDDAKVVVRNESTRRIAGHHSGELHHDFTERQRRWRGWKQLVWRQ